MGFGYNEKATPAREPFAARRAPLSRGVRVMRALYISAATAAVGGLLMGAAIRPKDSDLHEQPLGPQIIASSAWEGDVEPVAPVYARTGPIPEYVIGTDWTRPKTYEPQIAALYELPGEPATYEPATYDEPAPYVAPVAIAAVPAMAVEPQARFAPTPAAYPSARPAPVAAPSAADSAGDAVESLDDGGAERVEIIRVDREGGGQIDNLAHGSDPHALVGEPAA
jgi:hypothetical protein